MAKPYLVYNIHLGRLRADKRIRGAEGGRQLIQSSQRQKAAKEGRAPLRHDLDKGV